MTIGPLTESRPRSKQYTISQTAKAHCCCNIPNNPCTIPTTHRPQYAYKTQLFLRLPPWKNSSWIFKTKRRLQRKRANFWCSQKMSLFWAGKSLNKICFTTAVYGIKNDILVNRNLSISQNPHQYIPRQIIFKNHLFFQILVLQSSNLYHILLSKIWSAVEDFTTFGGSDFHSVEVFGFSKVV